jgi:hypothetical protein
MKKSIFLILIGLISTMAINGQDLNLDQILTKHFEVNGQDKLAQLKTMKMVVKLSAMGMEMPMTMYKKRPAKMRMEVEMQGMKMIQTFNGVEGYMVAPWTGSTEPQKIGDDQIAQYKDQADMDGKFYNYKEKGNQLELVGIEDVNGKKAYKLKLIEKAAIEGGTAQTSYHFIDCENFNLVKITATANMQGVDTETEMYFTDYRQVEGVSMFYAMEMKAGGNTVNKMIIEEYKINEELADDLFEKPVSK